MKVPTLAFSIIEGCQIVGKSIGSSNVNAMYGVEIVKMRKTRPYEWKDFPSARDTFDEGDRLFVMIDQGDLDATVITDASMTGKDANTALMEYFERFFRLVGDLENNKDVKLRTVAELKENGAWNEQFALFVRDFCLESKTAVLQCERFSMFELPYLGSRESGGLGKAVRLGDEGRCEAIIGPNRKFWETTSSRPFPNVPPGCLALHMTRNFDICPKLICRKDGDKSYYTVPVKQETIIHKGDLLLVLLMGEPGSHKFELDPKVWSKKFHAFLSEKSFETANWLDNGITLADPAQGLPLKKRWADMGSPADEEGERDAAAALRWQDRRAGRGGPLPPAARAWAQGLAASSRSLSATE